MSYITCVKVPIKKHLTKNLAKCFPTTCPK